MNREEAIAILKDVVMNTDKLNKDGAPIEVVNAMLKGIEELEKLQKIEEIVNLCDNPCKSCRFFEKGSKACIFLKYEEIEKIVRGE